jgi:hypothetical protein
MVISFAHRTLNKFSDPYIVLLFVRCSCPCIRAGQYNTTNLKSKRFQKKPQKFGLECLLFTNFLPDLALIFLKLV